MLARASRSQISTAIDGNGSAASVLEHSCGVGGIRFYVRMTITPYHRDLALLVYESMIP